MTRTDQAIEELRRFDPALRYEDGDSGSPLDGARALFESRKAVRADEPDPRRFGFRRDRSKARSRVVFVASATAALVVLPLAGSQLLDRKHAPSLMPAAVASDGKLNCGEGFAKAIPPREAELRLMPSATPAGWTLKHVYARTESTTGWCIAPSLVALHMTKDGTVTGSIAVTGPVAAIVPDGRKASPDTIAGRSASRFSADVGIPMFSWIWSDDHGRQWHAESMGYPLEKARQLMSALDTDGTSPTWAAAKASELRLVHLRKGAPYRTSWRNLAWYLEYEAESASPDRLIHVTQRKDDVVPVITQARAGARVMTVAGKPAVLFQTRSTDPELRSFLLVEERPGVVVQVEFGAGELAGVERLVASLRDADPADPRLEKYRLDG